jgi:hypothetical protein
MRVNVIPLITTVAEIAALCRRERCSSVIVGMAVPTRSRAKQIARTAVYHHSGSSGSSRRSLRGLFDLFGYRQPR